jgi:hypothetical protein
LRLIKKNGTQDFGIKQSPLSTMLSTLSGLWSSADSIRVKALNFFVGAGRHRSSSGCLRPDSSGYLQTLDDPDVLIGFATGSFCAPQCLSTPGGVISWPLRACWQNSCQILARAASQNRCRRSSGKRLGRTDDGGILVLASEPRTLKKGRC